MDTEIINQKQPEKRENTPSREVWVIDDDIATATSALHYLKFKAKRYTFTHFKTAQSAVEAIIKREQEKQTLPSVLLVDGNLDADKSDFNKGDKVVRKIRELPEIEQPIIIACSSNDEENEKMEAVGANLSFPKIEFKKISEFLSTLSQNNSNNNKE